MSEDEKAPIEAIEESERTPGQEAADERLMTFMEAIPSTDENHRENWGKSGRLPCPHCGGKAVWRASSANGHIIAGCVTRRCFLVIQ